MFCVSDLHLENETKTNALWNFITEKNIHVVIMSEINEASKNIKHFSQYCFLTFYVLQLLLHLTKIQLEIPLEILITAL